MIEAGASFKQKFAGDIYDVSAGGKHSVYRYGIPFFMGVK
jgi:CRISPR-associated RAMP protein, csm4 family